MDVLRIDMAKEVRGRDEPPFALTQTLDADELMECGYSFHSESTALHDILCTRRSHRDLDEIQRIDSVSVSFVLICTDRLSNLKFLYCPVPYDLGRNIFLRLMARLYFSRCTTIRSTWLMLYAGH